MFRRLRPYAGLAALSGIALFIFATAAVAGAPQGRSEWSGQYGYSDGRGSVPFYWVLNISGGGVTGGSSEPATFGDGSSNILTAQLSGSVSGNSISIVKTYDGSGGQTHSVQYSGSLSADGRSISGSWSLSGASGPFSANLDSAEPQANMCSVCGQALRNDTMAGIDGPMPDTYVGQSLAKYDNCVREQPDQCRGTCAQVARDTVATCFGKGFNDAGFVACIKAGISGLANVPCSE